jgi:hypothetical protein
LASFARLPASFTPFTEMAFANGWTLRFGVAECAAEFA